MVGINDPYGDHPTIIESHQRDTAGEGVIELEGGTFITYVDYEGATGPSDYGILQVPDRIERLK